MRTPAHYRPLAPIRYTAPPARRKARGRGRGWRAVPWWGWLLLSPFLILALTIAAALAVATGGIAVAVGVGIGIAICQPKAGRRRQPTQQNRVRVGRTQDEIRKTRAKRSAAARQR